MLAGEFDDRRAAFQAALTQAEELWDAAAAVGPASRPLPLFYSLRQAGTAISAAWMREVEWQPKWHGIVALDPPAGAALDAPVRVSRRELGAFVMVAAATESPLFEGEVTLSQLWASLPSMPFHESVVGESLRWMTLRRTDPAGGDNRDALARYLAPTHAYFPGLPAAETDARLENYPTAQGSVRDGETDRPYGTPEAILTWPDEEAGGRRPLNEIGDTLSRDALGQSWAVRPRIGTGDDSPPSTLMTTWALLYGLSHLARYHPAEWVAALDLNTSVPAMHLAHGLEIALEEVPRLVYSALMGHELMYRLAREQARARAAERLATEDESGGEAEAGRGDVGRGSEPNA